MPKYQFHFLFCEAFLRDDSGKKPERAIPLEVYSQSMTGVAEFPTINDYDIQNGVLVCQFIGDGKAKRPFFLGSVRDVRPVNGYAEVDVVLERADARLSRDLGLGAGKAVEHHAGGFNKVFVEEYLAALRAFDCYVKVSKAPVIGQGPREKVPCKDGFPGRRGGRVDGPEEDENV